MPILPRLHLFEINDQPWFPQFLRERVQSALTVIWNLHFPVLQRTSPAKLVASTLIRTLGPAASNYVYIDFASGAGGPTPFIEKHLNQQLDSPVTVVLSDLHPHVSAWAAAAKKSDHLRYIPEGMDAANAPPTEELLAALDIPVNNSNDKRDVFRMFSLAFHHFDDDLAERIIRNTLETSSGFGIFELQQRTFGSFLTVHLLRPLMFLITPFYFWRDPIHLIVTYLIPIIPFVLVFDGIVSSMRTRTPDEVQALVKKVGRESSKWTFHSGEEVHTWPTGKLSWIICVKEH